MIAEWRKEVPADATVVHLGDLAYKGNARFKHLLAKELTGAKKLLVRGNHDRNTINFYRQCGFIPCRPFGLAFTSNLECFVPGRERGREDDDYVVSFSHYAWTPTDEPLLPYEGEAGRMEANHWRLHGHIHNNGYTRDSYVPFLRNHINLSVEQTKYKPVNLKLLLDAALLGVFPETTQEQLDDAARRKAANAT